MKILRQRTSTYMPHFMLVFTYGRQGGCFTFDCDEKGNVDVSKLAPSALANYTACKSGQVVDSPRRQQRTGADGEYENAPGCTQLVTYPITDAEVRDYGKWDRQPAVGECVCGEEVHLHGFTNTCECGRDYNMSGQLLADRSQWGEETGESIQDILSVDTDYDHNDYGCP